MNVQTLYWGLATASTATGFLLLILGGSVAFRVGVAGTAVLAATCMAVGDSRMRLLRNAWTGPFAASSASQVLIVALALPSASGLLTTALIATLVNTGLYTAMGLAGWVGFGDVKFVAGLTLFAVVVVGWASMLLPPLAIVTAAVIHAALERKPRTRSPIPHGPALAIAFTLILGAMWLTGIDV